MTEEESKGFRSMMAREQEYQKQFDLPLGENAIRLGSMTRLWFDTYYDPSMSPAENMNQAEAAVSNGWQPMSWPKEIDADRCQ